jgi:predicted nucleic acid-binding protein
VLKERDGGKALQTVAQMVQGTVVDLDALLAVEAARLSAAVGLPMADSIILATARAHNATLLTQDADFDGLPRVRYLERRQG